MSDKNPSIYEPEAARLQREIDVFISQLESERRQGISLDKQISSLKLSLDTTKQGTHSSEATQRKLRHRITKLERKLELVVFSVNEMQVENRSARKKVDNLRSEKQHYHFVIDNLTAEIDLQTKLTLTENTLTAANAQDNSSQITRMNSIRSKSLNDRLHFSSRFTELHSQVLEDRHNKQGVLKQLEHGMKMLSKQTFDPLEHSKVLTTLNSRWTSKIKSQKRSVDVYIKQLRLKEEAIGQITAASGIESTEDIVVTFVKSEEQRVKVTSYLNSLIAQIEMLEQANQRTLLSLDRHRATKQSDAKSTHVELQQLKDSIAHNSHFVRSSGELQSAVEASLSSCIKHIKDIVCEFQQTEFKLQVAERIDEFSEVDLGNLTALLGQIEEYSTCLLTFIGYANRSPSPELRAIDLKSMPKVSRKSVSVSFTQIRRLVNPSHLLDSSEDLKSYPLQLREFRARAKSRLDSLIASKKGVKAQRASQSFFL
jgi:chromosome segregation ATPase